MTGVLVVAETPFGTVGGLTRQLVGAARDLADRPVTVLLVAPEDSDVGTALALEGVEEVLVARSPVEHFEAHVTQAAVAAGLAELEPRFILMGHSADGLGVGPALAAAEGLQLVTDVVALERAGDEVVARTTIHSGKVELDVALEPSDPVVLMLREGAFGPAGPAPEPPPSRALDVDLAECPRTEHLEFEDAVVDEHRIGQAEIVLSVGRGIRDGSELPRFEQLAARLGGVLAVSGPLVSTGWAPSTRLIGQSGLSVTPRVYLALGISGAVQHLAGIRDADTVVAVNIDPDAAIFARSDFGVVADLFAVSDALSALLPAPGTR